MINREPCVTGFPTAVADGRRLSLRCGFSLIELIAVITILAILAGVATASFNSLDDRQVRLAANQTADEINYLRERAMATGRGTWLTFDINLDTLEFREDDRDNPGYVGSVPMTDPLTGRDPVLDLNETFGQTVNLTAADFDGQTTIGFDWRGRPRRADGSLLETSPGFVTFNNAWIVRVQPETGYAHVEQN